MRIPKVLTILRMQVLFTLTYFICQLFKDIFLIFGWFQEALVKRNRWDDSACLHSSTNDSFMIRNKDG